MLAGGSLLILLLLSPSARATNYYVSPTGSGTDCTHGSPCALSYGATNAQAGDYVVLLDGTYTNQPLIAVNSGTASAWITFVADTGAVPILDGTGSATPNADGSAMPTTGVGSDTSVYVQYIGLVARNWASGFSNQWTGSTTEFTANGNWKYINCIGDGNTRNGFAFNSAKGVTIHQCLSAHNGTSTKSSWSSAFQLYAVQGTASDNVVDENVAFENMDAQKHTDGSGFIVDTMVTGVAFINNIAFLNGGSCIRLTKSTGIQIINNTCYHNGRDTTDTGPTNPGEIYFTDGGQTSGLTFLNNIGVATGSTQDPTSAWVFNGGMGSITVASNNKTSATFAGADGTNPDFHLASGSPLINAGSSTSAPGTDIGFDPKCITKTKATDIAVPSWSDLQHRLRVHQERGRRGRVLEARHAPVRIGDRHRRVRERRHARPRHGRLGPASRHRRRHRVGRAAGGQRDRRRTAALRRAAARRAPAAAAASGASGGASGASGGASGASGGSSGATGGVGSGRVIRRVRRKLGYGERRPGRIRRQHRLWWQRSGGGTGASDRLGRERRLRRELGDRRAGPVVVGRLDLPAAAAAWPERRHRARWLFGGLLVASPRRGFAGGGAAPRGDCAGGAGARAPRAGISRPGGVADHEQGHNAGIRVQIRARRGRDAGADEDGRPSRFSGTSKNIGVGGLFVATERPFQVGDRLTVQFSLPELDRTRLGRRGGSLDPTKAQESACGSSGFPSSRRSPSRSMSGGKMTT